MFRQSKIKKGTVLARLGGKWLRKRDGQIGLVMLTNEIHQGKITLMLQFIHRSKDKILSKKLSRCCQDDMHEPV